MTVPREANTIAARNSRSVNRDEKDNKDREGGWGGADESVRKFGCSHAKSREGRATAIIAGKYLEGDAPFVSLRFPSPESVRREFESSTVVWVIEFGQLRVAERDGSRAECLKNLESEARGVIPRSKRDSREIPEILPRPRRKEERERERDGERETWRGEE